VDQRRLLLAFAVSLALLLVYQEAMVRLYPKPRQPEHATEPQASPHVPEPPPKVPIPTSGLEAPLDEVSLVTVETDTLRVAITPRGARLAHLELKAYRRTVDPNSGPLDLVAAGSVLPLTLQLGPAESDAGILYRAEREGLLLHGDERGEITFSSQGAGGVELTKTYRFSGNGYLFEVESEVSGGQPKSSIGVVVTAMPPETPAGRGPGEVALALAQRELVQKPLHDLSKEATSVDGTRWAGFAAQYFLFAAAPEAEEVRTVLTTVGASPVARLDLPTPAGKARVGIFAGPKDRDVLERAGHDLSRALDFGWFWFIALPLLRGLEVLHRVTGNYGVAIIVLTTLVKAATIPLTQTTFRNMREMQKLAPQVSKLRERFKDDQMALQKEMMELYKRHRVNPLSGCLPMVLQIPIFVGLYNALGHAIELRHAPFALWINDLSAPDRLMIGGYGVPVLTLLMGASMFLQQWLTPQQGDPTQQRVMMLMPVMFTFMFIGFPAGLVLYWLVNNLLGIAQQYWMMRQTA
jgi:YidC/Oxa1 family membrane protein insertase